jgi:drug/metabolite transporter (DMT)-like permease
MLIALLLRRPLPRGAGIWAMLALAGLGSTSLGLFGMFYAAGLVSPGIATVIANVQPLLAAGLAGIFLGERLTGRGKAGLLLGFLGIVAIASPRLFSSGGDSYTMGIGLIVLAAIGVSVGNVVIKRLAGNVDALVAMGLQMLMGSIPLVLLAFAMEAPGEIRWMPEFVAILLALSLFGTALVYWLWFTVLERVKLNQANTFSFLVPVFGLTIGALFFGETLGWPHVSGIVLILIGVRLVTTRPSKPDAVRDRDSAAMPEI